MRKLLAGITLALAITGGTPTTTGTFHAANTNTPHTTATASTWTRPAVAPWCAILTNQPAYGWTNPDGSTVKIPTGKRLIKYDIYPEHKKLADRNRACYHEVTQYREHEWR